MPAARRPTVAQEPLFSYPDRLAQRLFSDPLNVQDLLRLAVPELADRLQWQTASRFPRLVTRANLSNVEGDVAWRVRTNSRPARSVLVMIEHKHRREHDLPLQMLAQQQAAIEAELESGASPARTSRAIPVLFYTGMAPWRGPLTLQELQRATLDVGSYGYFSKVVFVDLHRLDTAALEAQNTALGWSLRLWQTANEPVESALRVLAFALTGFESSEGSTPSRRQQAALFSLQLQFHTRPSEEYNRMAAPIIEWSRSLAGKLRKEVDEMARTMARECEERGIRLGEERGMVLGSQAALLTVLKGRCGAVPAEIEAKIRTAEIDQLQNWLIAAGKGAGLELFSAGAGAPANGNGLSA
jgi:hypothetical protein